MSLDIKTSLAKIKVYDTHTCGEPTRIIFEGLPLQEKDPHLHRLKVPLKTFYSSWKDRFDVWRSKLINEPRGHEVFVGAIVLPPYHPDSLVSVLFFNNVGYLNMCGHGLIGFGRVLEYLGLVKKGQRNVYIDTLAGPVQMHWLNNGEIEFQNVPTQLGPMGIELVLEDGKKIKGDVAYGGNWFFITEHDQDLICRGNIKPLLQRCLEIKQSLIQYLDQHKLQQNIDHIQLYQNIENNQHHHASFVLCPGNAFDRSPCGTGTSAKMALLHAQGKLDLGQEFRQQGLLDGVFTGYLSRSYSQELGPTAHIRGRAYLVAENNLLFELDDPLIEGFSLS